MALAQRSNNMSDSFHREDDQLKNMKAGANVRESPTPKIIQGVQISPEKTTMPSIQPAFEMGRNMEL